MKFGIELSEFSGGPSMGSGVATFEHLAQTTEDFSITMSRGKPRIHTLKHGAHFNQFSHEIRRKVDDTNATGLCRHDKALRDQCPYRLTNWHARDTELGGEPFLDEPFARLEDSVEDSKT